jgi:serine protease Do
MKNGKMAVFAVVLCAGVVVAVAGLAAEARQDPQPDVRTRPRMAVFDGFGGRIGVIVQDLDADGLKNAAGAASGVRIEEVDQDSPAAKAGLREGDIITELDGERVRSERQFARLIQETPEGRSVALGIVRNGQRQTITVTPEARGYAFGVETGRAAAELARRYRDLEPRLRMELEPRLRELEPRLRELEPRLRAFRFDEPFNFEMELPRMATARGRLGVQLTNLTPQLAEYFGAKDGGVLVSSVTAGSPAEKAGLKVGDVITSVNGDRVRDSGDLVNELGGIDKGEVTIGIVRDKKESTVKATVEPTRTRLLRPGRPI